MNFFLQNPGLAWLAPLMGVPVLLHLLARAKPPEYLFSAVSFVLKVVQQTIRIKKPKDRLLLLCRTILFVVLFLIFIRPVVFFQDIIIDRDLPRSLIIIIDRSASMAWSEGGRSRFTAACDEAAVILDSLSSRDMANVVWLDAEPDAIFPEMSFNIAYLARQLRQAHVTNESGSTETAMQLALTQLTSSTGTRELCIISDFQASQWKDLNLTVPENISVSTVSPVREAAENGGVMSIQTEPVSPLVGEPARILCDVGNFSNAPRNRTVILTIGEKRIVQQVQIPAWGHGSVAVEHVFPDNGEIAVSAQLNEDAYGADDWRGMIVAVRKSLAVGLLGNEPTIAPVWRRALNALPWVEKIETTADTIAAPGLYDLLMIAGWHGENIKGIKELRTKGVSMMIAPAPGLSP
jgi:hypothetical protein